MHHVSAGGTHFLDEGHGPLVVLLHAFPLDSGMWRPQIEALRTNYRILAPDLPGFGLSRPFHAEPSVGAMAGAVARLLDELDINSPVVLGGLSMGGYVALAFARRHADRLRGLILADTKAEPDDEAAKANRERLIAFAESHPPAAVIEQMLPKMVSPTTLQGKPEVLAEIRALAGPQSASGIIKALWALRDRPDAGPGLTALAVPALVIVGRDDALTPPAFAEGLAGRIKGARLEVIEGAGHLSNLEQPERFNAAVREFLAGVS